MVPTRSTHSLIVKHQQIDTILSFSDIREWPDATQSFTRFVDEMSSALQVIQRLRQLIAEPIMFHKKEVTEKLFRTVIQATADYYADAHAYALCSVKVAQPATDPESKRLLDFELTAAPYIRELNNAMSVLQGYISFPLQVDRTTTKSVWDPRDWCIERLIKLIASHEDHLTEQSFLS